MTQIGRIYGEALHSLACEERLSKVILNQLHTLDDCFHQEPDYLRLLSSPCLPKSQRCQILETCFRESLHPYVLNFLKILTGKGYIRRFSHCVQTYIELYNRDNGILSVTTVTAVALTSQQVERLTGKLQHITGKRIALTNKLDPAILGGMRLDYDGNRLDDTISHRLDTLRSSLKSTIL